MPSAERDLNVFSEHYIMSKLVTILKRKLLDGFLGLLKTGEEFVYTKN